MIRMGTTGRDSSLPLGMTLIFGRIGERRWLAGASRLLSPYTPKSKLSFRMNPPDGGGMRNLFKLARHYGLRTDNFQKNRLEKVEEVKTCINYHIDRR
jgi:hypothetical protein